MCGHLQLRKRSRPRHIPAVCAHHPTPVTQDEMRFALAMPESGDHRVRIYRSLQVRLRAPKFSHMGSVWLTASHHHARLHQW